MYENIFKRIDNHIRLDSNCDGELDYAEQSSWVLFLKWLDDYQDEQEKISKLNNTPFNKIFDNKYKWSTWASPKKKDGENDFEKQLTGDDLKNFINDKLFPYLSSFKNKANSLDTIQHKIGIIFSEIKNKIDDGYILRDVIDEVDKLHFKSDEQKHELSVLYEDKIEKMGNAGRDGGQYYTPRPLIKTIVRLINPNIGEIVYDGACGSCGFLVETYNYIIENKKLSTSDLNILKTKTLFGKEKKKLGYLIGIMNMILHGIESPNISKGNTLEQNVLDINDEDKVDVVLANPPFGGGEKNQIQENFPIKSAETGYLFIQHFIKKLKAGGRAAIVIKNSFLTNDDAILLRKELLESCNVHTILDLPQKIFKAGVGTVVLFFEKGISTKKIWYYQLNLDRTLGKKNPINDKDLEEFTKLFPKKEISKNSWNIELKNIDKDTLDLKVKNPNIKEEIKSINIEEIIKEIENIDSLNKNLLNDIKKFL
jgi:type I restriction enzyme M protein